MFFLNHTASTEIYTNLNTLSLLDALPIYFDQEETYAVRFAVVMTLQYFLTDTYRTEALKRLSEVRHDAYYVKMAVAWAVSMAYVKYPFETKAYLFCEEAFNEEIRARAIQKILESNQVHPEEKLWFRQKRSVLFGGEKE